MESSPFCWWHKSTYHLQITEKIQQTLKYWSKTLTIWLNANKISLNASKTELIIFKPKRKPPYFNRKIKLNGKRLHPTDPVRFLGVKIDSKLNWKSHVNAIATKLNRANAMPYKVRDFFNANILKSTYYA